MGNRGELRIVVTNLTGDAYFTNTHYQSFYAFGVASSMRIVELHADDWVTAADFMNALKKAIGAPDWHGSSVGAFLDSMIYHDDINALKSPYTIKIAGADKAKPE